MNDENLEVVQETKLLGVMLSDNLKWDQNTDFLVKKAYKRMELLRKVSKFTLSKEEKKNIYVLYIRSILEQSCVVWHSSLTQDNLDDLERVQKCAVRIILGKEYPQNYEQALVRSDLDLLKERRPNYVKILLKSVFKMKKLNTCSKKTIQNIK